LVFFSKKNPIGLKINHFGLLTIVAMLGPRNIHVIHKMDDDISRADVLVAGLGLNVVHYVVSFVDSAN